LTAASSGFIGGPQKSRRELRKAETMAKSKPQIDQTKLDALAERAQELSFEISDLASIAQRDVLSTANVIASAHKFNQLVSSCGDLMNSLLAIERHRQDVKAITADIQTRSAQL
jgi:hypothetical protein